MAVLKATPHIPGNFCFSLEKHSLFFGFVTGINGDLLQDECQDALGTCHQQVLAGQKPLQENIRIGSSHDGRERVCISFFSYFSMTLRALSACILALLKLPVLYSFT